LAKPPLERPSSQDGPAGIAETLEYRGQKAPVGYEIGSDGADHDANNKRWIGAPTQYDQDAGSDTRRRLEYRHVRKRREREELKPGCQKIDDRDDRRTKHS